MANDITADDGNDKPKEAKKRIKNFFIQTFRRHSGKEYSELLTRGMTGEKGVNKKYPWAYVRLFTLLFVLYAVFLLIVRFTSNELFTPTIALFASVTVNLSFLLFIYELYPERDLSFLSVVLAMLIGGAGANILAQILFNIFPPSNLWLNAVYSGFFEELPKAAVLICIIIVSRKNSPLAGFVMGAAIGCGFSIVEDLGYIFTEANQMSVMNLTTIIEISAMRAASSLCTHILWTAAVGWAYCHFERHFANVVFYLILLLSCGLHIAWDLPLSPLPLGFVYGGCALAVLIECCLMLFFERRKVFKKAPELDIHQLVGEEEEQSMNKTDPLYWSHWGNLTFAIAAFLMALIGVLYCSIPFRETYAVETFSTKESFVQFMQNGMVFNAEQNRPYNSHDTVNDSKTYEDDKLVKVVQRVPDIADLTIVYNYEYTVSYDSVSGKEYFFPASVSATVTNEVGVNTYYRQSVYNEGELYVSYFSLNGDVTGYNFQPDGSISVFVYNPGFVRDLSDWRYLSLFCTFAAFAGASSVVFVSLKIKSWRVKKQCSIKNASSAE